jgi:hypothetical protein
MILGSEPQAALCSALARVPRSALPPAVAEVPQQVR